MPKHRPVVYDEAADEGQPNVLELKLGPSGARFFAKCLETAAPTDEVTKRLKDKVDEAKDRWWEAQR